MESTNTASSRFMSGLFSGFKSSLLMMGIYTALMVGIYMTTGIPLVGIEPVTTFIGALSKVVPFAAIGVAVTSLYSAISNLTSDTPTLSHTQAKGRDGTMRSAHITQAPVVAMPIVMGKQAAIATPDIAATAETAPQANAWQDRVNNAGRNNRIHEILANGSLNDKARAEALLEARATQQQSSDASRA